MRYLDLYKRVLSWHYLAGRGEEFWGVLAQQLDDARNWARAAVRATFPRVAPPEALPYIAQSYNLELPEEFTVQQQRDMLVDAFPIWERSGSHEGILTEVRRLGYPECEIVPVWQYRWADDGTTDRIDVQYTIPRADEPNVLFRPEGWPLIPPPPPAIPSVTYTQDIATQGRFVDGWWLDKNYHWSSFYVVIHQPHPFGFRRWREWHWGDGGRWDALVTGNRRALQRLKRTIQIHRDNSQSCRGIIFTYRGRYKLSTDRLYGVWSRTGYDTWAVGAGGVVRRWNGADWLEIPSGTTQDLHAVWGRAADDVYIVGNNGTVLHWDGAALQPMASATAADLRGVYGVGAHIWAVGASGTIIRLETGLWSVVPSGTLEDLLGVWALSRDEVWAVGRVGTALRWNGLAWVAIPTGTAADLYAMWGTKPDAAWAVGGNGTALRWNGAGFAAVATGTAQDLYSVWGTAGSDVVAVGALGTWIRWNGAVWTGVAGLPPVDAFGVHGTDADNMWIVTAEGVAFWGQSRGALYWSGPWGGFGWGDGTKYNLKFVLSRMREPWET